MDDVERLIAAAEERFGPVDTLVNNAGTNPYYGPIAESEDWAWDKTMDVNLRGPYLLSRRVGVRMMAAGGGSIVNISSVAGLEAASGQGIYSVTKAGLIMLTKVMAREMGAAGVRVNCICPGVIRTQLSRALWDDEKTAKAWISRKALGRVGEVDELIGAADLLRLGGELVYYRCGPAGGRRNGRSELTVETQKPRPTHGSSTTFRHDLVVRNAECL